MTKGEIAKQYFLSGYNCSTSVVLAFKDEIGLSEEDLKKIAIGFGGGFARQRLTCGAVSGMAIVLSMLLSDGENKQCIYNIIQTACNRVKEKLGSIICGDLLSGKVAVDTNPSPENRTEEYYKKRPCAEICSICALVAENMLKENS